jgi:ABC-type spermidine/putrescine transport system permease subunit I
MQQKDGLLCGTTPHLTSFAVLLSGGGNNGQFTDQCTRNYVTGSSDGDIALAASVAGLVLLTVVIVVVVSYTQTGRRLVSGRTGAKASLRELRNRASNSAV